MERIKQAIDKARAQAPASAPFAEPAARGTPHTAPPPPRPHVQAMDVSYVHTEVVPLDPAHLEEHRIVAYNKASQHNWAFDVLRTQVLQKMDEKGWRTLAITSPTLESGKTVVSINLAMSIAHHSQRTAMLVDFDLRRPRVASYLGLSRNPSLNEVLAGQAQLHEAMVNPGLPRLVVVPTNRPVPKAAEVLSSQSVGALIEDLRDRYDDRTVIFDLPPMMAGDDVMSVLPRIDAVLMVIGNGNSTKSEIEESMRHIPADRLLGVVLNKAEAEVRRGYY